MKRVSLSEIVGNHAARIMPHEFISSVRAIYALLDQAEAGMGHARVAEGRRLLERTIDEFRTIMGSVRTDASPGHKRVGDALGVVETNLIKFEGWCNGARRGLHGMAPLSLTEARYQSGRARAYLGAIHVLLQPRHDDEPHDERPTNLNEVVRRVVRRDLASGKAEHYELLTNQSLPTVHMSDGIAFTVFRNLISNAVRYRSLTQPLRIAIFCGDPIPSCDWWSELPPIAISDRYIGINVVDNARGIAQSQQAKVFKPFNRGAEGPVEVSDADPFREQSDDARPLGVGLTIVAAAVAFYRGRVRLASSVGSGSNFCIQLPKDLDIRV